MTSRLSTRLLALGLLAGAAIGAWYVWPTDARRITARLDATAAAISAPSGEGDFLRVARLASLAHGLAPDIVLETEPGGAAVRGREAVVGLASHLGAVSGTRRLELSDVRIAIDASGERATALAAVRVTPPDGLLVDGEVIRIELAKIDGEWLIAKASREPALSR